MSGLGQPYAGRLWCAQDVTMRTVQTPDLRDPHEQPKHGGTVWSGVTNVLTLNLPPTAAPFASSRWDAMANPSL